MTNKRRGLGRKRPEPDQEEAPWEPGPVSGATYSRDYTIQETTDAPVSIPAKPAGIASTHIPHPNRVLTETKKADKKARKILKRLELSEVKTVQDLLRHYNISNSDWDYLVIGDGSGTGWGETMGWGSTLICKSDNSRRVFYGAMSSGTNNTAELMAALHPLSFLVNNLNWADRPQGIKVHVVTDSKYVADGLTHDNPIWVAGLTKNRELWMALHMTRRRGIEIIGHHLPRNSIDLATFGHELANASRKRLIGVLTELKHQESNECESKSPPETSSEISEKEPTQKMSGSTTESPKTAV